MNEEDGAEKPFEATPRKLEQARKRGEVPVSQDLVTVAVYAAVLAMCLLAGAWSLEHASLALLPYVAMPERLAETVFGGNGHLVHVPMIRQFGEAAALWFLAPVIAALGVAFLQGALVFAGQKIQPKLSRVSPVKNIKQKYGPDGLFNFVKSFVKLGVFSLVLGLVFWGALEEIVTMPALPLPEVLSLTASLCVKFMAASASVVFAIAIIDYFWQRAQFLRRQRMTLKELKDELKDTEGDPYTKQTRRQKAVDIATNQMLKDVPDADVVVVNPEHFAVALKWSRRRGTAPVCVAKGVDEIAARIREIATENAVPIHRDPATARALHASVEIGEEIAVEHYQAAAAAIRFADAMREKARKGR